MYLPHDEKIEKGHFITYHIYREGDRVCRNGEWFERTAYKNWITNIPLSETRFWRRVKKTPGRRGRPPKSNTAE